MKRNIIETVLGAVVLLGAGAFLVYGSAATQAGAVEGYEVHVNFNEIGALGVGDDVRLGGVKVGSIKSVKLDSNTYQADVTLSIEDDVKLPTDTAARVSSESLMGGAFLALDPGGDEDMIKDGGKIAYAQDAQNLETLLGKFIFSMSNSKEEGKSAAAAPAVKSQPVQPQNTEPQTDTPPETVPAAPALPTM